MRRSLTRTLALLAATTLVGAACSDDDDDGGGAGGGPVSTVGGVVAGSSVPPSTAAAAGGGGESVLDAVLEADVVRCGVRDDLPGFDSVDAGGDHVGFDADFCRVIAAAVLGDASKVEFVDVETDNRFTALQAGEFDVLVRNTTWTASRDGVEGTTFLHPTFYDGQSMMVAADSGFSGIDDMDQAV